MGKWQKRVIGTGQGSIDGSNAVRTCVGGRSIGGKRKRGSAREIKTRSNGESVIYGYGEGYGNVKNETKIEATT